MSEPNNAAASGQDRVNQIIEASRTRQITDTMRELHLDAEMGKADRHAEMLDVQRQRNVILATGFAAATLGLTTLAAVIHYDGNHDSDQPEYPGTPSYIPFSPEPENMYEVPDRTPHHYSVPLIEA